MFEIILTIICLIPIMFYILCMRKHKFTTKEMTVVGLFSALSFILSKLYLVHYPQGGGISLFSTLPILLVGVLFSKEAGMTAGLITGILSMIIGGYVVNVPQAILDYVLAFMALGFSGIIGNDKRVKILFSSLLAVVVSTAFHIIAGVIFFGSLAPEGMSPIIYSIVYNFSGTGLEGVISTCILFIVPINRLKTVASK